MPEYHCIDCFINNLVCKGCCQQRHLLEPLHQIQVCISDVGNVLVLTVLWQRWNGEHFESTCLHKIGLRVQLNHTSMWCRAPIPGHIAFKVLHHTRIHDIAMDYCGYECQIPYHKQLLRCGWYPASHKTPTTCATFHLLKFLHLLLLCLKVSIYNFYWTLEKILVNTGLAVSKSCIKMLMWMKASVSTSEAAEARRIGTLQQWCGNNETKGPCHALSIMPMPRSEFTRGMGECLWNTSKESCNDPASI